MLIIVRTVEVVNFFFFHFSVPSLPVDAFRSVSMDICPMNDLGPIPEVNIFSEIKLGHEVLFFSARTSLGDFYLLKCGNWEILVVGDSGGWNLLEVRRFLEIIGQIIVGIPISQPLIFSRLS